MIGDENVVEVLGLGLAARGDEGGQDLDAGLGEFGAHQTGKGAAENAGADREDQIERPDVLVVRREQPAGKALGRVIMRMVVRMTMGVIVTGMRVIVSHVNSCPCP